MCSSPRNCVFGKGFRQETEIAPLPKYLRKSIAMTTTPTSLERPLEMAAPATPRAGRPMRPFISSALQPMFMTFTRTDTSIVCFMSWQLRKKAVKVRYTACSTIPAPMMRM